MSDQASPGVTAQGGCLCGAVRYEVRGPLRGVVMCHCGQCLRSHGHFAAYTSVSLGHLTIFEEGALKWFEASDKARRGFCGACGSRLFWEPYGEGRMSVAAGSFDQPSGLKSVSHIFMKDAGDYYEVSDGLPQHQAGLGDAES